MRSPDEVEEEHALARWRDDTIARLSRCKGTGTLMEGLKTADGEKLKRWRTSPVLSGALAKCKGDTTP